MTVLDTENIFSMPMVTPTYDAAANGQLRLSALLRWQQEIGERQTKRYRMDWRALAEEGFAFVLARGCGVIHRLPEHGEEVTLQTWSDHIHGVQFFRGYRLLDAAGETLTESMASFALVDVNTHRLCRPSAIDMHGLPTAVQETACPLPPALKELPPLRAVGEWTVRHSSVDFNRHLNNTVYADLLCDFLPAAVRELPPKAYALQYVTEAREGDTLTLYYGAAENDHFVEARVGDTRIFVGRITV